MVNPEIVVAHIRANILRKIEDAGYPSIEKFAFENGLIKTTISRAIKGTRNPRIVTLVEIANGLDMSLQELLELDKIETVKSSRTAIVAGEKKSKK